jgi:hypothetical protein
MKPNFFGRVCYMDGIGRQTAKWDQKMGNVLAVARRLARYELPDRYILTSCGFDGARFILNRGVRKCLKELALDLNHGSI